MHSLWLSPHSRLRSAETAQNTAPQCPTRQPEGFLQSFSGLGSAHSGVCGVDAEKNFRATWCDVAGLEVSLKILGKGVVLQGRVKDYVMLRLVEEDNGGVAKGKKHPQCGHGL